MAKGVKTGGRKKGTPNKVTADLRAAIMQAFSNVGGSDYLEKQSEQNPTAFMTLLGRVLPLQHTGEGGGPLSLVYEWRKPSASTPATNHAPSSGPTTNGHNGSALGSHTAGLAKQ